MIQPEVKKEYEIGTKVKFNVANGLHIGTAVIAAREVYANGDVTYLIKDVEVENECIDKDDWIIHCEKNRELWLNDFEITGELK